MAQLLVLQSERSDMKFDELEELSNSKSQGICDEDCHIADKIKYFEPYDSSVLRSPSKKQDHQKQNIYNQENQQSIINEDSKSKESDKESSDDVIQIPNMVRHQSLSLPLRQNKQRLNTIKNLKGDQGFTIEECQEQKNTLEGQNEENKGASVKKEEEKNDEKQIHLENLESEDEDQFQLEKQKKILSAPPIQQVKSKSPSSLINIPNVIYESPIKANTKVEFHSEMKSSPKFEITENSKAVIRESFMMQARQSREDVLGGLDMKRKPSRKFSVRQKQVSEEFIKFNVETTQLDNLDQKELKMINVPEFQHELPEPLIVQKKVSAIDEMIPQEPDKSYNMEKLQAQMSKTQSKKNIDDKSQKNVVCEYYVKPLLRSVNLALRDNISCLFREHFLTSFQSFHMINTIPIPSQKEVDERSIIMPPFEVKKKKTLILDLDETLIHCNESLDSTSDFILDIQTDSKEIVQAGINVRPFAKQFLEQMSELYEIVIFTASRSIYANEVINKLDPQNKFVFKRLFREHCVYKNKIYIKDLRIFKNRDIKNIVIVDNCCLSFCHNILNGIPIVPFYEDKRDQELLDLAVYLTNLAVVDDVRPVIKNSFKFKQYKNFQSPSELIREIY